MYQNLQQNQSNQFMQYPYMQQQQYQQRLAEAAAPQYTMPAQNYIKGRPVVSIEEARASQIDLDGSLFVFTDIGNKKIYTKQINLDGTATLNTYSLVENAEPVETYVTKSEFNQAMEFIKQELKAQKSVEKVQEETTKQTTPMFNFQ